MSYQSDINNKYYAISWADALAVLQTLDKNASAGTGMFNTKDINATHNVLGTFDGNVTLTVNGQTYDLKNTHAYNSSQAVYSNNVAANDSVPYNLYDVVAIAKAAGYDNRAIADALNEHYKTNIKTLINSKDTFKSQREFRARFWTPERVAEFNSTTGPAYDSLKQWLDDNYPGAIVETTLDPEGNRYHYRIRVGDQWVDIEDPAGRSYTEAELDNKVKQNGAVANVLQNQTAQNNLIANAEKGKAALEQLAKNIASGATAETNFNLSDDDYKALTVAIPDFEKQIANNAVIDSSWIKDMGDRLTQEFPDTYEGAGLKKYLDTAQASNNAGTALRQAEFDKTASIVQELKSNPDVYRAVMEQFNTDAHQNLTAGQRAANLGKAVQAAHTEVLPSKAAESLEQLASAGADSLSGQQRTELYDNLVGGTSAYTEQQLNKLRADKNTEANEVANLGTVVKDWLVAMGVEEDRARRFVNDEISRSNTETEKRKAAANAASATSIEKNSAYVGADQTIADMIKDLAGTGNANNVNAIDTALKESKKPDFIDTGYTVVDPKLVDPNQQYLDESVYNKVIADPDSKYKSILSQEAFDKFTKAQSVDELAELYGLEYLKDIDNVSNMFTDYAKQANKASDRMLSQAQRAYLSALAAGDTQTIDALTKLAGTASAPKQNLLNASALTQQLAQQQKDAAIGTKLITAAQQQRAANAKQIADATNQGRTAWTNWLGSGDPNKDNGLYSSMMQGFTNNSNALNEYSNLLGSAMKHESNINSLISDAANATNKNLTDLSTTLTGNNAAGAVSNIKQSAIANNLKKGIAVQNKSLEDIIKTGKLN